MGHQPLHDALLARTIEWATTESPFYRRHFHGCPPVASVSDLSRLPLLTKRVATAHQEELRCGPEELGLGTFSSGTTGASLLRVEHSSGEREALSDFLASVGYQPETRRILEVVTPNHGYPGAEKPGVVRLIWAPYRSLFSLLADALRSEICGRRIDVVSISLAALKECTAQLVDYAKHNATALWLIGHVTGEGDIAGPKTIEHEVDVVLELTKGERLEGKERILRCLEKNRFGEGDRVGHFQLTATGLVPVDPDGWDEEKL